MKTPQTDAAETQAIAILGFLASDPERLGRFLTLTGVDPGDIRRLKKEQGFWQAIFDHLFDDESLLLAYCAEQQIQPASLVRIRHSLARPNEEGLREG
jgi:Protein of unknown function (DUF3572)